MKTGLGLYSRYRLLVAYYNVLRFWIRKTFVGFDLANQFIQRLDKISTQVIIKRNGADIGDNCDIEAGLIFHNCKDYKNLKIGDNCHIGKNCFFDLRDKITIGKNVVISMQTTFITHIDMAKSSLSDIYPQKSLSIIIEDNCYIGARSTILSGVVVKKNAFIAAAALVNTHVEEGIMVGGMPARKIKILKSCNP